MYYDPELFVYHERRPTLRGFAQQMHKYGRGRGLLLRREPSTFRPWYAAPSALLAYLLALPFLLLTAGPPALLPLAAYVAAVVAGAAWIARTLRRPGAFPLAAMLLLVLHACYGAGVVRGLSAPVADVLPLEGRWAPPPVGPAPGDRADIDLREDAPAPKAAGVEPRAPDLRR